VESLDELASCVQENPMEERLQSAAHRRRSDPARRRDAGEDAAAPRAGTRIRGPVQRTAGLRVDPRFSRRPVFRAVPPRAVRDREVHPDAAARQRREPGGATHPTGRRPACPVPHRRLCRGSGAGAR
jgi:hypothetical protein